MQFLPGSKVKVFECYEEGGVSDRVLYEAAIVQGNFPMLCHGHPYSESMVESYGVLVLDKNGEPDFTHCWIEGAEMELIDSDLSAGFALLAKMQEKNAHDEDAELDDEEEEDEDDSDDEEFEDSEPSDHADDDDEDDEDEEETDDEFESGPAQIVRVRVDGVVKGILPAESLSVAANTLKTFVEPSALLDKIDALFQRMPNPTEETTERELATYVPESLPTSLVLERGEIIELNLVFIAFADVRNDFERRQFLDSTSGNDLNSHQNELPKMLGSVFESPYTVIADLNEMITELADEDGLVPYSKSVLEFEVVAGDLQDWYFFGFDVDDMEEEDEDEDDSEEEDFEDDEEDDFGPAIEPPEVVEMRARLSSLRRADLEKVCDGVQVAHKGFTDKKIVERLIAKTGFRDLNEQIEAAYRF